MFLSSLLLSCIDVNLLVSSNSRTTYSRMHSLIEIIILFCMEKEQSSLFLTSFLLLFFSVKCSFSPTLTCSRHTTNHKLLELLLDLVVREASVAQNGEQVVLERVANVLVPVGVRSLVRHRSLHENSKHGNHREAPVLKLLHLELSEVLATSEAEGVEAEVQRVEREVLARVQRVSLARERQRDSGNDVLLRSTVQLRRRNERKLKREDDGQRERDLHAEPRLVAVVEHVLSSLVPDGGLAERHTSGGDRLRHDHADKSEHGPARVDELGGAVLRERLLVRREVEDVESVVARQRAVEHGVVVASLEESSGQEEAAVGAVPLRVVTGLRGSSSLLLRGRLLRGRLLRAEQLLGRHHRRVHVC
mmetsp:Transcript_6327/g.14407  ORF Transcript_6327/g.14407 Transcript_6327/m.14407 type:complete len:362 (+) Transcript_6327:266-1351(+)